MRVVHATAYIINVRRHRQCFRLASTTFHRDNAFRLTIQARFVIALFSAQVKSAAEGEMGKNSPIHSGGKPTIGGGLA
jgi:hypothetical protein